MTLSLVLRMLSSLSSRMSLSVLLLLMWESSWMRRAGWLR